MSLKLNSSGGGSVTLQEPSTASNVTLTLPATTGTVALQGGTGVGKVLQVVNATTSTVVSTSSSTMIDTGLTATITPTSTSSKILIFVSQNGIYKTNGSTQNMTDLTLVRGGSGLLPANFSGTTGATDGTAINLSVTASCNYLDSPATTSPTTYKTQFNSRNGTATVYVQYAGVSTSFITLMEIAA
jgi:hypothetical protein